MAIRVKHKVRPHIFESSDEKDYYLYLDDTRSEVTIDNMDRGSAKRFSVPASSAESLSLSDVDSVRGFYVELFAPSSGSMPACTININGTGEVPLVPAADGKSAKHFHEGGPISSIQITNNDATNAVEGRLGIWGDPS